ncbi:MAG: hypothetical protein ACRENC_11795, partial [Gemmatimonadaceae bacterium]
MPISFPSSRAMLAPLLLPALVLSAWFAPLPAQTVAAPAVDPVGTASTARPLPGPVYETPEFSRAVANGTRTRTGAPGPRNWVQHARYAIDASLDPAARRVRGRETVIYLNHSPDTLRRVAVYLRQNVFAPGSPRREPVPVTGGVSLERVMANGQTLSSRTGIAPGDDPAQAGSAAPGYHVAGTVMWIALPKPMLPGDSARFAFSWSYSPAPSPSDGREGREGSTLFFMGYWYPEIAVYDDVSGWVTDPYLNGAEFYMDPAEYDVRLT